MRNILVPVLVAMSVSAAAQAAPNPQTVEIRIDYSDLDLADARDVIKLERRIERAVSKACSIESAIFAGGKNTDEVCVTTTTAVALAEVDRRRDQRMALASK